MQKNKLFLIFGLTSLCLTLLLVLPFVMQDKLAHVGNTTDMTSVRLDLEHHSFEIPKAYMWYKPNWDGIAEDAIHMVVTLPDFLPYSDQTKIFYKGGPGLKYKISFDLHRLKLGDEIEDVYFKSGYLKRCKKNWQHFKICPYDQNPELFEVMVDPTTSYKTAFICPKLASQRSPFCHTEITFSEGIKLKIGMHESQLKNADTIVARTLQTLCQFRKDNISSLCS